MSRHSANGRPYWRLRRHWLASANHGWMIGCGLGAAHEATAPPRQLPTRRTSRRRSSQR